jgi:PAS domain S-box-containing protein
MFVSASKATPMLNVPVNTYTQMQILGASVSAPLYRAAAFRHIRSQTTVLMHFRQIVELFADVVLIRDPSGRILYANRAFRDLYNLSEQQLHAAIASPVTDVDMVEWFLLHDAQVLPSTNPQTLPEVLFIGGDGVTRWFHVTKLQIVDHREDAIALVDIARDITAQRRQTQRGEQCRELIGQLATILPER